MEDTYENRMLFVAMWYGAPALETAAMFPEWHAEYWKVPLGEDSSRWMLEFCFEALRLREKENAGK